jgi:putative spermidine/putrescine transport system permease protein
VAAVRGFPFWSWVWIILGGLYFLLPLFGTFVFSLEKLRDTLSFASYVDVFTDPVFATTFSFSTEMALLTIVASIILMVPTAYWVHLRVRRARPIIDFITLLPFVIPPIVLAFGLIRTYGHAYTIGSFTLIPPLTEVSTEGLLLAAYMVVGLPFMYRAVDNGLRAIDVQTLTEAALSLGAGWSTILLRIILPNLRTAILSGALLTFAIVVGEYALTGNFVTDQRAFGPYLYIVGTHRAYDSGALTIISFGLTWAALLILQFVTRGTRAQLAGAH